MKFGLSGETDSDAFDKLIHVKKIVDDYLAAFFEDKYYGSGIDRIVIGVICVSPRGEAFFKIRQKYTKSKKLLEYDIRLEHSKVLTGDNKLILTLLLDTLILSLPRIEELKLDNFDYVQFRTDFERAVGTISEA